MKKEKNTLFITFEGLDGSGKDSHMYYIAKLLRDPNWKPIGDKYTPLWLTREPTKITKQGKKISKLLNTKIFPGNKAAELYVKDRLQHSRIIEKQLELSYVLSSRYDFSTLCYQYTQGIDLAYLIKLHKYGKKDGTLIPDLTIFYTLPTEVAMKRVGKREWKKEFFENFKFQDRLNKNQDYVIEQIKKLQPNRKIIKINTDNPFEEVIKQEKKFVLEALVEVLN